MTIFCVIVTKNWPSMGNDRLHGTLWFFANKEERNRRGLPDSLDDKHWNTSKSSRWTTFTSFQYTFHRRSILFVRSTILIALTSTYEWIMLAHLTKLQPFISRLKNLSACHSKVECRSSTKKRKRFQVQCEARDPQTLVLQRRETWGKTKEMGENSFRASAFWNACCASEYVGAYDKRSIGGSSDWPMGYIWDSGCKIAFNWMVNYRICRNNSKRNSVFEAKWLNIGCRWVEWRFLWLRETWAFTQHGI